MNKDVQEFIESQDNCNDAIRKSIAAQKSAWNLHSNDLMYKAFIEQGMAFSEAISQKAILLNEKIKIMVPFLDQIIESGELNGDDIRVLLHKAAEIETLYREIGFSMAFIEDLIFHKEKRWDGFMETLTESIKGIDKIISAKK